MKKDRKKVCKLKLDIQGNYGSKSYKVDINKRIVTILSYTSDGQFFSDFYENFKNENELLKYIKDLVIGRSK